MSKHKETMRCHRCGATVHAFGGHLRPDYFYCSCGATWMRGRDYTEADWAQSFADAWREYWGADYPDQVSR